MMKTDKSFLPPLSSPLANQRRPFGAAWLTILACLLLIGATAPADMVAGLRVGQTLPLDMPELGAVGDATVRGIGPAPEIVPGAGAVVTGTFVHESGQVLDLRLAGEPEPIGVTASHPFWSIDREAFVPAGELRPGEAVRTLAGLTHVASIIPRAGPQRVYNLEVARQHVYHVGPAGLLVHNNGCSAGGAPTRIDPSKVRFSQDSAKFGFKDGGTINDLAEGLRTGKISPDDIPAIRLVERDGNLFTLDNRRLEAFRRAEVEIPYRMATPEEIASEGWKFTTKNEGISIRVRGEQ